MATVKPVFSNPEEPCELQRVLCALEQEERFVDVHDMIMRIGRVVTQEYTTGMEATLQHALPLAAIARRQTSPRKVRDRSPILDVLEKDFLDEHLTRLAANKAELDRDLKDNPGLVYVSFKNGVVHPVTGVEIVAPRLDREGAAALAYLQAYSGSLAVSTGPVKIECDIAAIPDQAAQAAVRDYDL